MILILTTSTCLFFAKVKLFCPNKDLKKFLKVRTKSKQGKYQNVFANGCVFCDLVAKL